MCKSEFIHLAADLSHYHTDYLWKMPGSLEGYSYYSSPEFYEDIARTASRGIMDLLFFGDSGGTPEDYGGNHHAAVRYGAKWPCHDMMPMIPCMARVADGVGFGITMSTTYHHPFHIARMFNALDHVTKGRIAWNAVTSRSKNEAANWGYEKMIEHDARYEQAQEHLHVCGALWDSIEPDAIILDRENGVFGDPEKVHLLNFHGRYYSVRGPLPALPSPQGRPGHHSGRTVGTGHGPRRTLCRSAIQHPTHAAEHEGASGRARCASSPNSAASRAIAAFFGRCGYRSRNSEAQAREMEQHYLDAIPPEAGLIELSSMYGLDFSMFRRDMRLVDVAAEVKAQNVHWGSFEEILKTTDPKPDG